MSKIKVAILFGGRSAEHEVSLRSAKNVIESLNRTFYDVILIGITKDGAWHLLDESNYLENSDDPARISLTGLGNLLEFRPGPNSKIKNSLTSKEVPIDIVFPVIHGSYAEDGLLQGMLEMLDLPFVGAGVLGSAIGMDKVIMKRVLRDAGLPVGKFLAVRKEKYIPFDEVIVELGNPIFIKPANLGSSVGISKVHTEAEYNEALELAFQYDPKVILEEFISGREIEAGVIGNSQPECARALGEIVPIGHEFYSYESKYLDPNGAEIIIPAEIDPGISEKVKDLAVEAFKVLCCEGFARIDFFIRSSEVYINEINTLPGFTNISMFSKLWVESGLKYPEICDRLIGLGLERAQARRELRFS